MKITEPAARRLKRKQQRTQAANPAGYTGGFFLAGGVRIPLMGDAKRASCLRSDSGT
jgi:hypothetical protein